MIEIITDEDIRLKYFEVNHYFKKEKFLLNNLINKLYEYDIEEFKNVYVIQYKKVNKRRFKEFILVKRFFSFKKEYFIKEETKNKVIELIKNNKGF